VTSLYNLAEPDIWLPTFRGENWNNILTKLINQTQKNQPKAIIDLNPIGIAKN